MMLDILICFLYIITKDMSIELIIKYKERDIEISVNEDTTVRSIKRELENRTKIPVIQQELSYKTGEIKTVLSDNDKSFKYIKLPDNTLSLKNLGKQIRWKNVFYI